MVCADQDQTYLRRQYQNHVCCQNAQKGRIDHGRWADTEGKLDQIFACHYGASEEDEANTEEIGHFWHIFSSQG